MTERYDRNGEITGFLVLNLTQDQYNPETDNAEQMICDWFEPSAAIIPDESPEKVTIQYSGSLTINAGGSWKKFTLVREEESDDEFTPLWDVSFNDLYMGLIECTVTDGVLRVRALDDARVNGAVINIVGSNSTTGAKCSVKVEVTVN